MTEKRTPETDSEFAGRRLAAVYAQLDALRGVLDAARPVANPAGDVTVARATLASRIVDYDQAAERSATITKEGPAR